MNEKIKELAKKHYAEETMGSYGSYEYDPHYEFSEEELEKFTKLIVRECIDVCDKTSDEAGCYYEGAVTCIQNIKRHFGVEP